MGSKSTGEQNPNVRKRAIPLPLSGLTVVDETKTRDHETVIITRERNNFQKSVQGYAKVLTAERSDERLERERKWFETAYTTRHEAVVSDAGDKYWMVETTYPKEAGCMYLNWFKVDDGEIRAKGNYHPRTHKEQPLSNSTVLWCQYQYLLSNGIQWGPLRKLHRSEISNEQTNDTARVCFLLSAEMVAFPKSWGMTWLPGDLMDTLLGTPNGKAGYFLVRDWGARLSIRGIESITVDKPPEHANRQTELVITFAQDDGVDIPDPGSF